MNIQGLIELLQSAFNWLIQTSWQSSLVIGIVLSAQYLFQKWMPPQWRYALWFLVVIRLSLPFAPNSHFSLFNWTQPYSHTLSTPEVTLVKTTIAPSNLKPIPSRMEAPDLSISASTPLKPTSSPIWTIQNIFMLVWMIGATLFAMLILRRNHRFRRDILKSHPITQESVLKLLEDCKNRMKVRAPFSLTETSKVKSPALMGFIRPRLLLPEGMTDHFSTDELRYIFLHELSHHQRRDVIVNWITNFLQVIHWFNPLVWLAFHRMRADREIACDSLAMKYSREGENQEYGKTIIKLLNSYSVNHLMPGTVSILESKSLIKNRIIHIASFGQGKKWYSGLAAILVALLGVVTLTNAANSGEKNTQTDHSKKDHSEKKGTPFPDNPHDFPFERPPVKIEDLFQKDPNGMIKLSLPNVPLNEFLKVYEKLTGKTLIIEQLSLVNVQMMNFNLVTEKPVTKEDAIALMESTLILNNIYLIDKDNNSVMVMGIMKNPRSEALPIYQEEEKIPKGDRIIKYIMKLDYISASEAAIIFSQDSPPHQPYGMIAPVPNENTLIITESSSVVKNLIKLKKIVDIPSNKRPNKHTSETKPPIPSATETN